MNFRDKSTRLSFNAFIFLFGFPVLVSADEGERCWYDLKNKYEAMESYKDEGVREVQYFENNILQFTDIFEFKTSFVRPNKFRFEWKKKNGSSDHQTIRVIDINNDVEKYTEWSGIEHPVNLKAALTSVAGITGGLSYKVPSLLIAEIPSMDPKRLSEISCKRIDLTGTGGMKISMKYLSGTIETNYIDSKNNVIVRTEKLNEVGNNLTKEIIYYKNIKINSLIPDNEFTRR